jgi:hypothetical protein
MSPAGAVWRAAYDRTILMLEITRPDHGHGPHPHRSWLHLLAQDPSFQPTEAQLERVRTVLQSSGLAVADAGDLFPGPNFASLLGGSGGMRPLPMAGRQRGEVRVEAGVWRCYPDPGPEGFDTDPVRSYLAVCPACGTEANFFALRFPFLDPLLGACPGCEAELSLLELSWAPEIPMGRMEITFGDLVGRPSLRPHPVFAELEAAAGTALHEAHVTL